MSQLISVDDALAALLAARLGMETEPETVGLEDGLGRTLAVPLVAKVTQPPLAVSAMDGYAVRRADVAAGGAKLAVIGEAPAGQPFGGDVGPGQAVRIFTGGAIPRGADQVVIQENAVRAGDAVVIEAPQTGPDHVRPAGLDFTAGETLVAAGTVLGPAHLAVAAAANHGTVEVRRRPRVAFLANGDELKPPGSTLGPGEIVESSRYGLAALVSQWGGEPMDLGIAPDSVDAIRAHIARASDCDIIVPVGGASVGDHDHMRAAFEGLGYRPVFAKVAVKPGKPTWFSTRGDQLVLGLPGNPASALVCAHLFLRPLIIGASTGPSVRSVRARMATQLPATEDREAFLRARLTLAGDGAFEVTPAPNQDSSLIRPFLEANALIRRRPGSDAVATGEVIEALVIGEI